MRHVLWVVLGVLSVTPAARGWWDTQVRAQQAEPLVKAVDAHRCAGAKDIRRDDQANGGRGGQVAFVAAGGTLSFKADLKRGVYVVWIVARARRQDLKAPKDVQQELDLPGGKVTVQCPRPLVYATLAVTCPRGRTRRWYLPIAYRADYAVAAKLYFPLHVDGPCELSVGLDARSRIGLLLNRVELRDVLGNCPRKAAKRRRMLTGAAELAAIRKAFAAAASGRKHAPTWRIGEYRSDRDWFQRPRTAQQRRLGAERIWRLLPDWNTTGAEPGYRMWHQAIGRGPRGGVGEIARIYQQTGSAEAGWDGAMLLCAIAEKYPGLDYYYQEVAGSYAVFRQSDPLRWGTRVGKNVYSGWAGPDLVRLAEAYDALFDFIRGNRELAEYLRTRIPWISTPADVVELLDTNILQHGWDCVHRRVIRSDEAYAMLPLVQGPCEISRKMLADGLFGKVHTNMTDAGGIDDQAFTSYSRGGVHYIGSTLYVGPKLARIAELLKRYVAAGGDAKFDLSDRKRYPHLPEAAYTKTALHAAGGFPIIVGDAMDLRRGRVAGLTAYPSRVLEGFGQVVLEDGQGAASPLVKRAVAIHTGIGRGHAHQDTLNIEIFAHGCRLAPDLGGRHAGRNRASPNMRTNRMHNLVWVDDADLHNAYPGSTTSGTGWTTAFSPQPGAQYTANAARATSHPQVSCYRRGTAMIDAGLTDDRADMYVFDVFRVAGGKVHTYGFHGAYAETIDANVKLAPARSEEAKRVLADRPAESQREGIAVDPLVVTWPLRPKLQEQHQGKQHQRPARPVGLTMTLFGRGGEKVYVGGATSAVYPVDMPYLHVRRTRAKPPLVSVYPAIYEAHSGGRFITAARRLDVTPAETDVGAGVALAVSVGKGRRDVLFSSLKPATAYRLSGGIDVAGEFAFLSEDAEGPRMIHLVGGTRLAKGGLAVRCDRAAYTARIEAADHRNHSMKLSAAVPKKMLGGQVALLGNEKHWQAFQLAAAGGREASVVRTPRYYQSKIISVDASRRLVTTELEPQVYGCDTRFAEGTTLTNEAHDRFWHATIAPRERWMYLGWPGTDLSYPREVRLADVPDANKDGRRTLRLIGRKARGDEEGKVLLELEVTRVDPAAHVFYFKMPAEAAYQIGGWQYAHRELVNEDGSKKWWATYPGTSYAWQLSGTGPLAKGAFADADGDGKRKLYAYHFGPGDTFQLKTFIYVRRVGAGRYEVRANTPCDLLLPGGPRAEISPDRRIYRPIAAKREGKSVAVRLTAADLVGGRALLRLGTQRAH